MGATGYPKELKPFFLALGKLWRAAQRSPTWWCTFLRTVQVRFLITKVMGFSS